jgi:predicted secreted hydrolase
MNPPALPTRFAPGVCLRGWLLGLCLAGCNGSAPAPDSGIALDRALGPGDETGFARALEPRDFHFPADHGPHPSFRNEWWYLTGNLADPRGRRFGYQVTFFRIALTPQPPARDSAWASHQVWLAHAALTDVAAGEHLARERLQRQALGLAGARSAPLRVWTGDWELASGAGPATWRLRVATEAFGLELELRPQGPPQLQGDHGLSPKSGAPGNASYYYSIPRLTTRGRLQRGADEYQVTGLSWLDREWSTSALGPDQVGWDWFSMQLADGGDLMYYQLRRRDGSADPHSRGQLRTADGRIIPLTPERVQLTPRDWWQAPDGRRYPVAWRFETPALGYPLRVRALVADQFMDLSVKYWEGAVALEDARDGRHLGYGYLELAGYPPTATLTR